jgi:triacylglycerol esterase/lipase EstA (alpha/beta hydrolase family)
MIMKHLLLALLLAALPCITHASALSDVPASPMTDAEYVIYVHGAGVEKYGAMKADEDYYGMIKALEQKGFTVISEVRFSGGPPIGGVTPGGVKPNEYGKKVAGQVKSLMEKGVPPENITVVGFSKGGLITLVAAAAGENAKVHYVILAGCFRPGKEFYSNYANNVAPKLKGRILSMYDEADPDFGSCREFFTSAGDKVSGKEIKFETKQGHALFRKPAEIWMNPLAEWARSK